MYSFSKNSKKNLSTCHADLQRLFNRVIELRDCTIVWGYRGEADQNAAYNRGDSTKQFPNSKHNRMPSNAVDVAPYIKGGISWEKKQAYEFAGYVARVAEEMGIKIRRGADWNSDVDVNDQGLLDPLHFEVIK